MVIMDPNQEKWIQNARAQGYTEEQIQAALSQAQPQPATQPLIETPESPTPSSSGVKLNIKNVLFLAMALALIVVLAWVLWPDAEEPFVNTDAPNTSEEPVDIETTARPNLTDSKTEIAENITVNTSATPNMTREEVMMAYHQARMDRDEKAVEKLVTEDYHQNVLAGIDFSKPDSLDKLMADGLSGDVQANTIGTFENITDITVDITEEEEVSEGYKVLASMTYKRGSGAGGGNQKDYTLILVEGNWRIHSKKPYP